MAINDDDGKRMTTGDDDSNTSDAINMTKKYSQQNHVSDALLITERRGKLFWLGFLL